MDFEQMDRKKRTQGLLDKVSICIAEFLATTILVFVACMGCVPSFHSEAFLAQQSALTSGLAVTIAIFLFGHISGAHVNPLTSVAAVIVGQIKLVVLPMYISAQILGAVTGYGLLLLITPAVHMHSTNRVCVTIPNEELTTLQAVVVELLLSLILTISNCSSWDYRNKNSTYAAPLNFGFLVATLIMVGGPYTGASMNPAKSFAPAIWNNAWKDHWIYWLAPMVASVSGSYCYKLLFLRSRMPLNTIINGTRNDIKLVEQ